MAGHGTAEDALEALAIVWPGYFSKPDQAPPMPPLSLSVDCHAGTFDSILDLPVCRPHRPRAMIARASCSGIGGPSTGCPVWPATLFMAA